MEAWRNRIILIVAIVCLTDVRNITLLDSGSIHNQSSVYAHCI